NLNDSSVCVVNQTFFDAINLNVEAQLFDLHGNKIGGEQFQVSVQTNTYKIAGKLFSGAKPSGLYFARLILKNEKEEVIDENLYWLTNQDADMQDLEKLEPVQLIVQLEKETTGRTIATFQNNSNETSFFNRLKVVDKEGGELALPVFFSDNYVTLFPGEQKQ